MADLDAIVSKLRHNDVAVRESAMAELQLCVHRADGEAENESLEAWGKGVVRRSQDARIVEALLIAMEDLSARVRASAALILGHGQIAEGKRP
jgi:HEAT repeat protein